VDDRQPGENCLDCWFLYSVINNLNLHKFKEIIIDNLVYMI